MKVTEAMLLLILPHE